VGRVKSVSSNLETDGFVSAIPTRTAFLPRAETNWVNFKFSARRRLAIRCGEDARGDSEHCGAIEQRNVLNNSNVTPNVLGCEEAAEHIGFTVDDFRKWLQLEILPAADPITGGWTKQALDHALDAVTRNGWPSHRDLPEIQRQPRTNALGLKKSHHYRRGVAGALEGIPGSGAYMASLIKKNRQHAYQQTSIEQTDVARDRASTPSLPQSRVPAERQSSPAIISDFMLQMGAAPPSHRMPLYPTEAEVGVAVLGAERASEWASLVAHLEHEGLPLVDPIIGARFWPAVQKFFEARHGLDGGLATHKPVPAQMPIKIALHSPQLRTQIDAPNAASLVTTVHQNSILLTPQELALRWRGVVSVETLKNHRSQGMGVPYVKIGRQPLYRLSDVEQWEHRQLSAKPKP
jgi:hypothetical protein